MSKDASNASGPVYSKRARVPAQPPSDRLCSLPRYRGGGLGRGFPISQDEEDLSPRTPRFATSDDTMRPKGSEFLLGVTWRAWREDLRFRRKRSLAKIAKVRQVRMERYCGKACLLTWRHLAL